MRFERGVGRGGIGDMWKREGGEWGCRGGYLSKMPIGPVMDAAIEPKNNPFVEPLSAPWKRKAARSPRCSSDENLFLTRRMQLIMSGRIERFRHQFHRQPANSSSCQRAGISTASADASGENAHKIYALCA